MQGSVVRLQPKVLFVRTLRIDFENKCAHVHDHRIPCTPTEFQILGLLAEYQGMTLTPHMILNEVFAGKGTSPRTLSVHILRLRKKIRRAQAPVSIRTIHGLGFCLEEGSRAKKERHYE